MQQSQVPGKIPLPFATSGLKNVIPETTAGIAAPNNASFDVGFPALTMTLPAAGGIPPAGQDMNGILFDLASIARWANAGGFYQFDAAFAADTNVGGYPKGAVLLSADNTSLWLNTTDNNSVNPDTVGTGWLFLCGYGITPVTGLTNANVTLTPDQYNAPIITLAGTLTGNVQVIFPTSENQWLVLNNTTGNFAVTCKTAAGTGIIVQQGGGANLYGDGTNVNIDALQIAPATQPAHAVQLGQVAVFGSVRNLKASLVAAGTSLTFTADAVVVKSALNGISTLLTSLNQTVSTAAGTGSGKMDAGAAPASGYVAVYASWGPVVGAGAFLQNATSAAVSEQYGGANPPAGVTETQLISVWPTNSSGQFVAGGQEDRKIAIPLLVALNMTVAQPTITALSIASIVPLNARKASGTMILSSAGNTSNAVHLVLFANLAGVGNQGIDFNSSAPGGVSNNYNDLLLTTPQTLYYQSTTSSATPAFEANISGYEI
jgi:hypothetical protein